MTQPTTGPDTSKDAGKLTADDAPDKAIDKDDGSPDGGKPKEGGDGTDDLKGLKSALAKTRKERDDLVKMQREAELAKLPELERFKSENAELVKQVEKLDLENRRYKVGMKLGLPWSLAKRLTGDTDDEMESDGAELVKSYKIDDSRRVIKDDPHNKRPPNDAKKTGTSGKPGMNDYLRAMRNG